MFSCGPRLRRAIRVEPLWLRRLRQAHRYRGADVSAMVVIVS
jgi:hypothetical protein